MQPGSFSQLETLVQQGRLSVTFILGLARGGTTAFEKHVFRTLPYDANINEPSLLGPPPDSDGRPVDRIEATFAQVLAAVHKAQQHREGMIRVIVKEVTNKVLLQLMPHWRQLAHVVLVVVRHPPLQFESRIKSILDRIESGALTSFGIDQYKPADSLTVHGHPLFQGTFNGSWKEAWTKMKHTRDFSALGSGLARVAALHPFCDWTECQRAMWKGHPDACAEWEGSQMSHFGQLPDELCEDTLRWRLGWAPLQEQLQFLDEHPSVAIIDFSCFQMDPTSFVKQIHRMVAGYWGTAVNEPRGVAAESFEVCSTAACWDQDSWDKWYFKPCFSKAANSDTIEPMLKPPMGPVQLPKTLLPALEQAYLLYSELVCTTQIAHMRHHCRPIHRN